MNKYWKLKILVFKDNQQVLNIQGDETTNKRRRQNKLHLRLLIGDRVIANQTISTHSLQINMKKITFVDSNLVGPVPSQSPRLALAAQSYIFKVLSLYILFLWIFFMTSTLVWEKTSTACTIVVVVVSTMMVVMHLIEIISAWMGRYEGGNENHRSWFF